jgi:hypothetical protein
MSRWRVSLAVATALVPVLSVLAFADPAGAVSGKVTIEGGGVLTGVFVELSSPSLPKSQVAVTDTNGAYRFAQIPAGTYLVMFHLAGFSSVVKDDVEITGAGAVVVDAVLRPSMTEHIVVTAACQDRLPLTPATMDDVHTHPAVPRSFRAVLEFTS